MSDTTESPTQQEASILGHLDALAAAHAKTAKVPRHRLPLVDQFRQQVEWWRMTLAHPPASPGLRARWDLTAWAERAHTDAEVQAEALTRSLTEQTRSLAEDPARQARFQALLDVARDEFGLSDFDLLLVAGHSGWGQWAVDCLPQLVA